MALESYRGRPPCVERHLNHRHPSGAVDDFRGRDFHENGLVENDRIYRAGAGSSEWTPQGKNQTIVLGFAFVPDYAAKPAKKPSRGSIDG